MLLHINMARPVGFEPTTNRFEVCDSIQLSYGRIILFITGRMLDWGE